MVTAREAMAYVQQAMEIGLVPLVVISSFGAWMPGLPYRRTLAAYLCCDWCCAIRHGLRLGLPALSGRRGSEGIYLHWAYEG